MVTVWKFKKGLPKMSKSTVRSMKEKYENELKKEVTEESEVQIDLK